MLSSVSRKKGDPEKMYAFATVGHVAKLYIFFWVTLLFIYLLPVLSPYYPKLDISCNM